MDVFSVGEEDEMKFEVGTLTSSKVMYVVPEDHTPWQFIWRVVIPGIARSNNNKDIPNQPKRTKANTINE
jgi:hypothetical protein